MSVVESIPDMSIIEDDDEIFKECERLYTKYTKRQAMRINIDVFTRKLTTSENLEKLMDTLPSDFSSEFYNLVIIKLFLKEMILGIMERNLIMVVIKKAKTNGKK